MESRVTVIAVTETAIFFGMKQPIDDCIIYEISTNGSQFVIVNGEYYGHRLPYDDVNRLFNINRELAMEVYELLKSEHSEHSVCRMFIEELEELIEEDGQK